VDATIEAGGLNLVALDASTGVLHQLQTAMSGANSKRGRGGLRTRDENYNLYGREDVLTSSGQSW